MHFALFSVDPSVAAVTMIGGILLGIFAFAAVIIGMGIAGENTLWGAGVLVLGVVAGLGAFYLFSAPFSLIGGRQLAAEKNVVALRHAVGATYGLKLTNGQATALLGDATGGSRRDDKTVVDGPLGDSYILQPSHHVAHVQLMHVNNQWLLVNAGSQIELPRT